MWSIASTWKGCEDAVDPFSLTYRDALIEEAEGEDEEEDGGHGAGPGLTQADGMTTYGWWRPRRFIGWMEYVPPTNDTVYQERPYVDAITSSHVADTQNPVVVSYVAPALSCTPSEAFGRDGECFYLPYQQQPIGVRYENHLAATLGRLYATIVEFAQCREVEFRTDDRRECPNVPQLSVEHYVKVRIEDMDDGMHRVYPSRQWRPQLYPERANGYFQGWEMANPPFHLNAYNEGSLKITTNVPPLCQYSN